MHILGRNEPVDFVHIQFTGAISYGMRKRLHTAIMFCEYEYMVQVSLSDVEDLKRRPSAPQARHIISPDTDERGAEPTFIGTMRHKKSHLLLLIPVFVRID